MGWDCNVAFCPCVGGEGQPAGGVSWGTDTPDPNYPPGYKSRLARAILSPSPAQVTLPVLFVLVSV